MENYCNIKSAVMVLALFFSLTLYGCGSSNSNWIDLVKNGVLPFDQTVTFGNAMDKYKYFSSTKWEFFETQKKVKIVQMTGKLTKDSFLLMNDDDRDAMAEALENGEMVVQCAINADGKSFVVSYIEVNYKTKCDPPRKSEGDLDSIKNIYKDESCITLFEWKVLRDCSKKPR